MVDLRKLATLRERFEWLVSISSVYTRSRTPDATSLGSVPEITRCLFNPLLCLVLRFIVMEQILIKII